MYGNWLGRTQHGLSYRQVVVLWRWLYKQVWLYYLIDFKLLWVDMFKRKMHFSQKSDICIIFYTSCLPKVNLQKFGSNLNADGEVKRSQFLIFKVHLNYTKHSRAIASYFREVFDTSGTSCIHHKWLLFSLSLRLIVP